MCLLIHYTKSSVSPTEYGIHSWDYDLANACILYHVYYTTNKNNKENQCTDTTLVNKYIECRIPWG